MKITNVTVTLFKWAIEPWGTGKHNVGGDIKLGVLTVNTDEDLQGHAFLGSPSQGADVFTSPLIDRIKPKIVGRNPLDIGAIWQDMWKERSLGAGVLDSLGHQVVRGRGTCFPYRTSHSENDADREKRAGTTTATPDES